MKKNILNSLVTLSLIASNIIAEEATETADNMINTEQQHIGIEEKAEEKAEEKKYGIGASIGNSSTIIQIPINMKNNLRLEPYIGFVFSNYDNNSNTVIQAGAALHKMYTIQDSLRGYYGAFLGVESYSGDTSSTNVILGPVLGAEYYLNDKFCLGAEVKLNAIIGDTTKISTSSSVLVRYYF